jgi:hypothetical protein
LITVTTTTGAEQDHRGFQFGVDQGILIVADDVGTTLAVFAPGVWLSAAVVPS